ncbi:MAG: hypothetical protein WCI00_06730 [bacterium]
MRLVDWLFPLAAAIVFLTFRELKKLWKRRKPNEQISSTSDATLLAIDK